MLGHPGLFNRLNWPSTLFTFPSKLRFDRIDGESVGDVNFDHLVGIFATA